MPPRYRVIIYYRIDDANQAVRVLTVWHGARRQPKRFR
jgi:plasmid stabilization system protein ParE